MSGQQGWRDRYAGALMNTFGPPRLVLTRGSGSHVWDTDGNQYLDLFGGIAVNAVGHAHPALVEAVTRQLATLGHVSNFFATEPQVALAERLLALLGHDGRVFFTNSGTEANDAALMLATQYRKSNQVLAIRGSYHGKSHSTVAITGQRNWSSTSLYPFNVTYVHGGYRYRSPFGHLSDAEFTAACVADLENMIEVGTAGDIACMIAEPIQGVGGFVTPPDGFFGAMKEVLDRHGILFIADEVQTGWGRTGEHFWGYQSHGITPDIFTFAKGLGNGMAMAGVVASAELMDSLPANSISTFGGNPLSTAAAIANLDYVLSHDLQTNAYKVGNHLRSRIEGLAERVDIIGEVRGKGLMLGVELVKPGGKDPNAPAAAMVMEEAKKEGLLIGKGGMYGNVLRIAPALTLTEEEADEGYTKLEAAVLRATEG
jgi:4-aminobutyrate aminotransferase